MVIIWGSRLYGKTDEVPGFFHVATKFGHLWFVPLIPTGSHLVLEKTENGWRGVDIGLSPKSLLLAWARAACVVTALVSGIGALAAGSPEPGALLTCALSVVAFVALKLARPFRYASYERAMALGERLGLTKRGRLLLDLHFERIDGPEARRLLAEVEAEELAEAQKDLAARHAALGQEAAREAS